MDKIGIESVDFNKIGQEIGSIAGEIHELIASRTSGISVEKEPVIAVRDIEKNRDRLLKGE